MVKALKYFRRDYDEKRFWKGLYAELEIDEFEVAADLLQNNGDHGKSIEE